MELLDMHMTLCDIVKMTNTPKERCVVDHSATNVSS